jgi:hypothetical protein
MITASDRFKKICKIIHDRVALADSKIVSIFIGDFTDENSSVGDAVAAITRLVKSSAIRIIHIEKKANTEGGAFLKGIDFPRFMMETRDPTYDLTHLDHNHLHVENILIISVETDFLGICSERLGYGFPESSVRTAIINQTVKDIEDEVKKNPIKWHCPICRSSVGTLGEENKTIASYLEHFTHGEYINCKDRRHPNRFWIEDGKIRFGTALIPMSDLQKKVVDKESVDVNE